MLQPLTVVKRCSEPLEAQNRCFPPIFSLAAVRRRKRPSRFTLSAAHDLYVLRVTILFITHFTSRLGELNTRTAGFAVVRRFDPDPVILEVGLTAVTVM